MLDKEKLLKHLEYGIKEMKNRPEIFGGDKCCIEFGIICDEETIKIIKSGEFDIKEPKSD